MLYNVGTIGMKIASNKVWQFDEFNSTLLKELDPKSGIRREAKRGDPI
jgi:hypothetical protein